MKNKKLTYLLITLVVLIWGFVVFSIFGENDVEVQNEYVFNDFSVEEKDSTITQKLDLSYSDPFLSRKLLSTRYTGGSSNPVKKSNNQRFLPKKHVKTVSWPAIEYGGTINTRKGLVKVNNRLEIISVGDTLNHVIITKLFADSIFVSFKSETKTIHKNKF